METEKSKLRKEILAKCRALSEVERDRQSALITKKFFRLPEYAGAKIVGCYLSQLDEVRTYDLMVRAYLDGKRIVLPRMAGESLEWRVVTSVTDTEVGPFGISEPKKNLPEVSLNHIDLLVVPGVAFDHFGNRLGRGKGYYDRVLQHYKGSSVGLAFTCQLLHKVPTEQHDQKVGKVLTVS